LRKLKVGAKAVPLRYRCPYCSAAREGVVELWRDGKPFWVADVDGDGKAEAIEWTTCRCGAEFMLMNAKELAKIPEDHEAIAVKTEEWSGKLGEFQLYAVKRLIALRSYTLRERKKGRSYEFVQLQTRFPSDFKTLTPGLYAVYHGEHGEIVLQPRKKVER